MKFDVYYNIGEEVKVSDNETQEKIIQKRYKNITEEEAKQVVNDMFNSIPENASHLWLNVEKTYEERLDDALKSI